MSRAARQWQATWRDTVILLKEFKYPRRGHQRQQWSDQERRVEPDPQRQQHLHRHHGADRRFADRRFQHCAGDGRTERLERHHAGCRHGGDADQQRQPRRHPDRRRQQCADPRRCGRGHRWPDQERRGRPDPQRRQHLFRQHRAECRHTDCRRQRRAGRRFVERGGQHHAGRQHGGQPEQRGEPGRRAERRRHGRPDPDRSGQRRWQSGEKRHGQPDSQRGQQLPRRHHAECRYRDCRQQFGVGFRGPDRGWRGDAGQQFAAGQPQQQRRPECRADAWAVRRI